MDYEELFRRLMRRTLLRITVLDVILRQLWKSSRNQIVTLVNEVVYSMTRYVQQIRMEIERTRLGARTKLPNPYASRRPSISTEKFTRDSMRFRGKRKAVD